MKVFGLRIGKNNYMIYKDRTNHIRRKVKKEIQRMEEKIIFTTIVEYRSSIHHCQKENVLKGCEKI